MKTETVAGAQSKPNPHGVEAKTLYDHEEALISHLALQPGQALKKHVTPVDVAFYVLEGQGEVEIGDERQTIAPDILVESPKGVPHLWRNVGSGPLRILVMKLPRPTEKTKML